MASIGVKNDFISAIFLLHLIKKYPVILWRVILFPFWKLFVYLYIALISKYTYLNDSYFMSMLSVFSHFWDLHFSLRFRSCLVMRSSLLSFFCSFRYICSLTLPSTLLLFLLTFFLQFLYSLYSSPSCSSSSSVLSLRLLLCIFLDVFSISIVSFCVYYYYY